MNQVSIGILAILFLLSAHPVAGSSGAAKSKQKAAAVKPSLDTLVSRVDGYWNALLKNRKGQAAEYVAAADRDKFYSSNPAAFSNPRLKSLELSADRKEATVTVVVTRIMLPYGVRVDWPVTGLWRFEKGNWYRTLPPKSQFLLSGTERKENPAGEDVEALKNETRKLLRFEKTILDFGTVRGSTPLSLSVKYTLGGKESLGATISAPAGFGVQGLKGQVLNPGNHELQIIVPTWQLDGAVNERIVLTVRRPGVAVPFEIEIKGNVYVPVSIVPKSLKFKSDEGEKEVRIRNNTKSDLEILPVLSETQQVLVQPLPATVLSGQEIVLKVKLKKESASLRANQNDSLTIPFARPVDGVNALSLNVIFNADESDVAKVAITGGEAPLLPADKSKNCTVPSDMK